MCRHRHSAMDPVRPIMTWRITGKCSPVYAGGVDRAVQRMYVHSLRTEAGSTKQWQALHNKWTIMLPYAPTEYSMSRTRVCNKTAKVYALNTLSTDARRLPNDIEPWFLHLKALHDTQCNQKSHGSHTNAYGRARAGALMPSRHLLKSTQCMQLAKVSQTPLTGHRHISH